MTDPAGLTNEALAICEALLAAPDFIARFGNKSKAVAGHLAASAVTITEGLRKSQEALAIEDLELSEMLSWIFQGWIAADSANIDLLANALTSALKA